MPKDRTAGGRRRPPAQATHLANLAHELATPLAAIVTAAEMMRDQQLGPLGDPRYRAYAGDIHDSARHALAVLASMLSEAPAPASPAAPAGALPPQDGLDLNGAMAVAASAVRVLIEAAGIALTVDLAPDLPPIHADGVGVRRIAVNLLTNALRATPAGGQIILATRRMPAGGVVLAVVDSGCGMDPATLAQIVGGRRSRARGGATSAAGGLVTAPLAPPPADNRASAGPRRATGSGTGSGRGLPMVARLAARDGARLTIRSRIGAGTTVEIVFDPAESA